MQHARNAYPKEALMATAAVADPAGADPGPGPRGPAVPSGVLRAALELYLDLHAHPELSGAESRTAARFADALERAGCTVTRGVGGHGVVGVLTSAPSGDGNGRPPGPTVLLRAELDALPVAENTALPYASSVPGVMHACGHDLHLAALYGAVAMLAARRERWRGTVLVVGQPAEETLDGARAMLEDGLYARFGVPDVVLAQHTAPLPAGTVAHGDGPVLAGSTALDVRIHGRGGHGGAPQLTVDPVVTAAAAVLRLQTVVSRETAPAEQAVLTVGALHAGERANLVPESAALSVGLRAFSPGALARMETAVERIVRGECAAGGCPREPEFAVAARSPVLQPDADLTTTLRGGHARLLGTARVLPWQAGTAAEDFAWFGAAGADVHGAAGVRTAYWMLGVTGARTWRAAARAHAGGAYGIRGEARGVPANHAPEFAPDVRVALPTGIAAMCDGAEAILDVPEGETCR
ncbi:amidohydrolase [Streptomyces sp. RKND-216]|uniref:amidohydrolase n=1 Tax=Streptomyces sp. RKND-216 TaxID=2562581 RepID=UPI001FF8D629|nr:amidohydrolase [Streptomyces sp. RKND-216]